MELENIKTFLLKLENFWTFVININSIFILFRINVKKIFTLLLVL